MPAPARIPKSVLILVPAKQDTSQREVLLVGRQASHIAFTMGNLPFYPLLYFGTFLTEEEIAHQIVKVNLSWAKRVTAIWLCPMAHGSTELEYVDLDPLSHRVLRDNEGVLGWKQNKRWDAPTRVPVYLFTRLDDGPCVTLATRDELSRLLMCNLSEGLFHGVDE